MPRVFGSPNMSDTTILMTVENLINVALGPPGKNLVNFKLVQTILHILARQMRLLEQLVEIRADEAGEAEASPRAGRGRRGRSTDRARIKSTSRMEEQRLSKEEKADAKTAKKGDKEHENADAKEREKGSKAEAKEKGRADKMSAKEKEKQKRKGRVASDTSIVIKEVERQKEKVLVAEKGLPRSVDKSRDRDGIEVVTRSQFDKIADLVKGLQQYTGPLPPPAFPDNEKLRSDLAKGQASLTDTMQAMQVTARVHAAEQAIGHMTDLLTQLAAAGVVPEDVADQIEEAKLRPSGDGGKSGKFGRTDDDEALLSRSKSVAASHGSASRASVATSSMLGAVTYAEMEAAISRLREDLMKTFTSMTSRSAAIAEAASHSTRSVSEKMDTALKIDSRISTLFALTTDYAEQLSGFDSGLTTQMQGFREQIAQMHSDLGEGLALLKQVNNNAETAAVLELTEQFSGLVEDLNTTTHEHRGLTATHKQLAVELQNLIECVEMLREQKADRDEVIDGLRDKADNSRLFGLVTAEEFAASRLELEKLLEMCHDKFQRQEDVWMTALNDLKEVTEQKAEYTQLLAARELAERMLRELHDRQIRLAMILGEPMAALLTRALSRDATCGACRAPALMPPDAEARPRAPPCEGNSQPIASSDQRTHTCHRWVGGSHTLLTSVTRERAPPLQLQTTPITKYAGYGDDGRLYRLEEGLQPCVECNKFLDEPEMLHGGGDQGPPPSLTG